jgi:hypothetical protein
MTLALVAWCKAGVALCADSRSSFPDSTSGVLRIASDSTEKLFQVGRTGVVTSGYSELLDRRIFSHVQDFATKYTTEPPSMIASDLATYFRDLYQRHIAKYPQQRPQTNQRVLEFLVGGFEGDEPACYKALIVQQDPGQVVTSQAQRGPIVVQDGMGTWRLDGAYNFGWIGDSDVVESLIHGYQRSLLGANPAWDAAARNVPIGFFGLQDCVDLLYFLCQSTERMKHFSSGDGSKFGVNRTVGGAIDVAVVRETTGFQFLQKKVLAVREQLTEAPVASETPGN